MRRIKSVEAIKNYSFRVDSDDDIVVTIQPDRGSSDYKITFTVK